jgi:hypothetical protein
MSAEVEPLGSHRRRSPRVGHLLRLCAAVDAGVRLAHERVLRRLIRRTSGLLTLGLRVPHTDCLAIDPKRLASLTETDEVLGEPPPGRPPQGPIWLIALPSDQELAGDHPGPALLVTWRRLLHARIDRDLQEAARAGKYEAPVIRNRIERVGQVCFDEIRLTLEQEGRLVPPKNDRHVYFEFVALWAELSVFAPQDRRHYFPSLDPAVIDGLIGEDVDVAGMAARTRLDGAPEPGAQWVRELVPAASARPPAPRPYDESPGRYRRLVEARDRAVAAKNHVRAILCAQRSLSAAPLDRLPEARTHLGDGLARFARRIHEALGGQGPTPDRWAEVLGPLVVMADRTGRRGVEARLLDDLEGFCFDGEREIHTVDLVEWALTFGKRPLRRELPAQRHVQRVRHGRRAHHRLASTQLAEGDRQGLDEALGALVDHAEQELHRFAVPRIEQALESAGISERNAAEGVARRHLVDALLEAVAKRGLATSSHLRDAVAAHDLKLGNLASPTQLWSRHPMLKADRELAVALDGVYRRAEVYLRWLGRLSAVFFGTAVGRWLVRFAILPFGGAFVILEGLQHLVVPLLVLLGGPELQLLGILSLTQVGGLILGLIHSEAVRDVTLAGLRGLWRVLRFGLLEVPRFVLGLKPVRAILESPGARALWRWGLKPALLASPVTLLVRILGGNWGVGVFSALPLAVLLAFSLNTPLGRRLQEDAGEWLRASLRLFRVHVIPGLIEVCLEAFAASVDLLERRIYAVDEWFRFRGGEPRLVRLGKPALMVIWFVLTYFIRIYVNLLIEPQANPVKHFPVVTVAHKVTLPMVIPLTAALGKLLVPLLGDGLGTTLAATTVFLLPGVFGFLVWELKANWRLYAHNRPAGLEPVIVGHHSETMARLMRPGFHSGTVPRAHMKLRSARLSGDSRAIAKHEKLLEETRHAVGGFVGRELGEVLRASRGWEQVPLRVGPVTTTANRVVIGLESQASGPEPAAIAFEEQSGWLMASIDRLGWIAYLDETRQRTFRAALCGLYKRAGVDLVREHVAAWLGGRTSFDVSPRGLSVWPEASFDVELVYPLRGHGTLVPKLLGRARPEAARPLRADNLRFSDEPLLWRDWVAAWERDRSAPGGPTELLPAFRVLPTG